MNSLILLFLTLLFTFSYPHQMMNSPAHQKPGGVIPGGGRNACVLLKVPFFSTFAPPSPVFF